MWLLYRSRSVPPSRPTCLRPIWKGWSLGCTSIAMLRKPWIAGSLRRQHSLFTNAEFIASCLIFESAQTLVSAMEHTRTLNVWTHFWQKKKMSKMVELCVCIWVKAREITADLNNKRTKLRRVQIAICEVRCYWWWENNIFGIFYLSFVHWTLLIWEKCSPFLLDSDIRLWC